MIRLKVGEKKPLVTFEADVFMCSHSVTGAGLGFWELRLLTQDGMVEAFHWDAGPGLVRPYRENQHVVVSGRWVTPQKLRLQVVTGFLAPRCAANDPDPIEIHTVFDEGG